MIAAALALIEPPAGGDALVTGRGCALRTIGLALGPWAMLVAAIRRGAPVQHTSAAAYAGIAALLASSTVLRATCPESGTLHWLGWHLATVAGALVVSVPLAATWLRTWRRAAVPN
jgi:hypothetical protein